MSFRWSILSRLVLCSLTGLLACQESDTIISQGDATPTSDTGPTKPQTFIDRSAAGGDESSDVHTPIESAAGIQGTVAGVPFAPTHTIVLRGRILFGAKPFATIFVSSDVPDMCEHLQNETLPANGTMLALALVKEGAEGPTSGDQFLPGGSQGYIPMPMLHGFFRRLDNQCHIDSRLLPHGSTAQTGTATLTRLTPMGGILELEEISMGFDDDELLVGMLHGSLQGPLCDAPKLFENAGNFFRGEIPAGGCIGGL